MTLKEKLTKPGNLPKHYMHEHVFVHHLDRFDSGPKIWPA